MKREDWPTDLQEHSYGNWKRGDYQHKQSKRIARRVGNDDRHRRLVRQLPCTLCGDTGDIDPHHLKSGLAKVERGVGMKATDRWLVPLCRICHDDLEHQGSRCEFARFLSDGINPYALAGSLFLASGELMRMARVLHVHALAGSLARLELQARKIVGISAKQLQPIIEGLSYREMVELTTLQVIDHYMFAGGQR
jgi:hypothetical protein